MSSANREFASFVAAVSEYKLDERNQKTTSHTSAASTRWDPMAAAPAKTDGQ
jgi:hypothetical protein